MSHIFISYSRNDVDFASKIVQALAESDLDTWIDWNSIPSGEKWRDDIFRVEGLRSAACPACIAIRD